MFEGDPHLSAPDKPHLWHVTGLVLGLAHHAGLGRNIPLEPCGLRADFPRYHRVPSGGRPC